MKKSISIVTITVLLFSTVTPMYAKTIKELQQEQQQIRQKAGNIKDALNSTTTEKNSVENEIEALDNNIVSVENEIDRLGKELDDSNQRLTNAQTDLAQAQNDKDRHYETLKKRIKYMYENGSVGYLDVLLNFKDFSDLLNRVEYINTIIEYDNNILGEMEALEETIQQKVAEISTEKKTIELLARDQEEKKHALEESKAQKEQIRRKLANDEQQYKMQLEQQEKDDAEITALIQKAKEEAERKAKEEAARKAAAEKKAREEAAKKAAANKAASSKSTSTSTSTSTKSTSTTYTGGKLAWPLPGYDVPNGDYGFGSRANPLNGRMETHRGMDIPAPRGTTVYAAAAGTVITARYINSYGNAVIIDHGGGLSTVYGHNSSLIVSEGQTVSKGQAISRVGSTGDSTGNHLHFEVRINGKYTNPIPYVK